MIRSITIALQFDSTMIPTAIYTIWHTASILDCMTL
jgi:hypothetical protein